MAAPLPDFQTFLPLLSFLVAFLIVLVVLWKTKIVGNKFLEILISFVIAVVFVAAVGPMNFILAVIPWVVILIVGLFLFMVLIGFVGKDMGFMTKGIGITFVVLLALIFLVSAFFVFAPYIHPYLPGTSGSGGNPDALMFFDWVYSPRVAGAILLLGISAVVAWVLVKAK